MVLKEILAPAVPQKRQAGLRIEADLVGQSVRGIKKVESIESIQKSFRVIFVGTNP